MLVPVLYEGRPLEKAPVCWRRCHGKEKRTALHGNLELVPL
jgi:hypothetical protein